MKGSLSKSWPGRLLGVTALAIFLFGPFLDSVYSRYGVPFPSRTCLEMLAAESSRLVKSLGMPSTVNELHIRCLTLTLAAVILASCALVVLPRRTRRAWALAAATLGAAAHSAILLRQHEDAVFFFDDDPRSLLSFLVVLPGLVAAVVVLVGEDRRSVLACRTVALLSLALAASLGNSQAGFTFGWGAGVLGVFMAAAALVESRERGSSRPLDPGEDGDLVARPDAPPPVKDREAPGERRLEEDLAS